MSYKTFFIGILICTAVACSKDKQANIPPSEALHIDPQASTEELELRLKASGAKPNSHPEWAAMASMTKRLYAWQSKINAKRSADQQISFYTKGNGYTVDAPYEYNEKIILQKYEEMLNALPEKMRVILIDSSVDIPEELSMEEALFQQWGRRVIGVYEMSIRWDLMNSYLDYYRDQAKEQDIRGYYFLVKIPQIEQKLSNWKSLKEADQIQYSGWLINMCFKVEDKSLASCAADLNTAKSQNSVNDFYKKYLGSNEFIFNNFFKIEMKRKDIRWLKLDTNELLKVPFQEPANPSIAQLISSSAETAWYWNASQLKIEFIKSSDVNHISFDTPRVEFKAGATPHVDMQHGVITMDENVPTNDLSTKSILAHEFGHVLGFPDCYVEFYDEEKSAMINYQLDLNNIMCSRKGSVLELHYKELKKAYGESIGRLNSTQQ